jgi:hypothetical protein
LAREDIKRIFVVWVDAAELEREADAAGGEPG